jgi:hypothetical protein
MLENEPSYRYYVPNPSEKSTITLTAWTRTTAYWDIDCSMDRKEAQTNYAQYFSDPTAIYGAESAANAMFWISVVGVGLLAASCTFLLKGKVEGAVGLSLMIALGLRCCWIVTLPIVFHRVNVSWDISQENLLILES